ncbi:MAG: SurA N-terminal domain-containing protein [Pseudomonadota bacterium]
MLDFLRRGVKTWVAKGLFALLVASFAIWGIGDVFSFGLGSSVATVGDQKITAQRFATALNQEIRTQSQRFGQPIDADLARAIGLPQQVLARMAQEATLDQSMVELGLSAPDDAVSELISNDRSFQDASGAFDPDAYRYLLAQADFTVQEYEEVARKSVARSELARALSDGGAAPAGAVDVLVEHQTETRSLSYVTLTAEAHGEDPGAPDESALAAYHEENADAFTAPERRTAVYLHLDLDALGADHQPEDAEVEALYDLRSAEYSQPERRALYQIVYSDEDEAEAAAARVAAGDADFDALLADRGETRADASLGDVTADEIPSAAGAAAFELPAEGVAGPVDTGFGFALVDVAAITPAETVPLEDAREELLVDLRREAALDIAPEVAGEIDDLRAGGSTLEEIASEMGLELLTATSVDQIGAGATGFAAERVFLSELFAAEDGEERDIVETDEGAYFVLRVDGIEEAALRPLSNVRDLVEAGWRAATIRDGLLAKAEELSARLDTGAPLADIAAELGVEIESEGPKTRLEGWSSVPADAIETLFDGEVGASASAVAPTRADAVVLAAVTEITAGEGTEAAAALRERLTQQMSRMAGEDALSLFLSAKQQDAGVTVNEQLIDSLLLGYGGGGHGGY